MHGCSFFCYICITCVCVIFLTYMHSVHHVNYIPIFFGGGVALGICLFPSQYTVNVHTHIYINLHNITVQCVTVRYIT